ncbi:MAG TPA: DUF302 domain-containing protein [Armatimonadota bacterium]|nr:DUF302 domain-containing protein [Armatimonadota bacterium]
MSEESGEIVEIGEGPSVRAPSEEKPAEHHAAAVLRECAYGVKVWLEKPYGDALDATKRALAKEGFDLIAEVDLRQLLRERLGLESPHYTILGVFNPESAREALELDRDIGLLLPFNLVVYEETGGTIVEAIDPIAHLAIADSADLRDIARSVRQKLQDVIDHIAAGLV